MMESPADALDRVLDTHAATAGADRALVRLDDLASYRVHGADAIEFLSRQLTCDVRALGRGRSVHGAWLSAKGRILALVRLAVHDDDMVLALGRAIAEPTVRRLAMFVLRADVRFEPAPELAWVGVRLSASAGTVAFDVPDHVHESGTWHGVTVLRVARDPDRFALLAETDRLAARCAELLLEHGFARMEPAEWHRFDIESGLPRIDPENVDRFVPQMLNLDRTAAVSFTKGCYPGQEVVARTQHLGRIKRRMFIARGAATPDRLRAGAPVERVDVASASPGHVVCSAPDGERGSVLLVVLPMDDVAAGARFAVGDVVLGDLREPAYGFDSAP